MWKIGLDSNFSRHILLIPSKKTIRVRSWRRSERGREKEGEKREQVAEILKEDT